MISMAEIGVHFVDHRCHTVAKHGDEYVENCNDCHQTYDHMVQYGILFFRLDFFEFFIEILLCAWHFYCIVFESYDKQ